jgi:NAD-dependent dihydropyrimidine dehydrogenase PreA subunit
VLECRTMPVIIDQNACNGCESCIEACPNDAIELVEGKAKVIEDDCIDCGLCEDQCPEEAITME